MSYRTEAEMAELENQRLLLAEVVKEQDTRLPTGCPLIGEDDAADERLRQINDKLSVARLRAAGLYAGPRCT